MSGRPILSFPWRQAYVPCLSSRSTNRCLHSRPFKPPSRHQLPIQCPTTSNHHFRRQFAKDSTRTFTGNARILFRQYPIAISFAIVCILVGSASLLYVNYYYQTYIIGAYHNYPEEVAKKLRRAIYYTSIDLKPDEAINYYKQALQVADELGMDPFSDEVMGIKINVAALMEKINMPAKAIEVLERVKADNLKFLELYGDRPDMKKKRTHVLAKTVAISVKLGEHYSNPRVWDRDTALEQTMWAVETVENEKRRRKENMVTIADEGEWISDDEQGAALEALAHQYEEKDLHFLSAPLFLQALSYKEAKDCHTVILMNNLATSLAQQNPRAARAAQKDSPSGPVASRESLIENAKLWAQKALDVAAVIKPPERDEECNVGCAVATHNLGEFAEMLGNTEEARKKYLEAVSLSRAIGFAEGVENSSARLRKLDGTS